MLILFGSIVHCFQLTVNYPSFRTTGSDIFNVLPFCTGLRYNALVDTVILFYPDLSIKGSLHLKVLCYSKITFWGNGQRCSSE